MYPKKTYEIYRFDIPEKPNVAVFDPVNNILVAIDAYNHNTFRVFDIRSGNQLFKLTGMGSQNSLVIFGKQAISGSGGGQLFLWDLEERIFVGQIGTHGDFNRVTALDITNDDFIMVSGDKNGTVRYWDFSASFSRILGNHSSTVDCVAISSNGEIAISGSLDGKIKIWDCFNLTEINSIEIGNRILGLDISHDGEHFINIGGDISKRNLKTAEVIWSRDRMSYGYGSFSLDDGFILCGGPWIFSLLDSETGADLISFEGQTGAVIAAGISTDAQQVYSAADDGSVRIWRLPL